MVAKEFELAFLCFLSSCAVAENSHYFEIDNKLFACLSTTNIKQSNEGVIPVLHFDLKIHKPIAECGCKSALGLYTVSAQMDGYRSYIIGGKIGLAESGHRYIPLSAEGALINKKRLVVGLACAQPD
ncbi:DUF2195 family protein [Parasulfuritortus cantonensis]|uniref:DUF2195 family protein n=1 Tax=Parasulfuritortus cantonensis TaxID=2528202 RepID=A0A4R1B5M7_9PROT|nr:DUF2195 family protein [Parasulfuritortus cantonensis]TCJ12820.1 DUF2195 family protein [Parasulfuritortus cantonensis]